MGFSYDGSRAVTSCFNVVYEKKEKFGKSLIYLTFKLAQSFHVFLEVYEFPNTFLSTAVSGNCSTNSNKY